MRPAESKIKTENARWRVPLSWWAASLGAVPTGRSCSSTRMTSSGAAGRSGGALIAANRSIPPSPPASSPTAGAVAGSPVVGPDDLAAPVDGGGGEQLVLAAVFAAGLDRYRPVRPRHTLLPRQLRSRPAPRLCRDGTGQGRGGAGIAARVADLQPFAL